MIPKKDWRVRAAIAAGGIFVALLVAGFLLASRFEPYLRERTIAYLERRFRGRVELESFRVSGNWKLGLSAELKGLRIVFPEAPGGVPFLTFRSARCNARWEGLWDDRTKVRRVSLEGLEINIPPKGQRPKLPPAPPPTGAKRAPRDFEIEEILADGAVLRILPRDPARAPLQFDLHNLRMTGTAPGQPMRYEARLTNAKPPGMIRCIGTFGPWNADELGETPLSGDYTFRDADLGVFKGVAGIMVSKGVFRGVLNNILVDGTADVPDFRLTSSGNPVPLQTTFHATVDGTNGNTFLDPVGAQLGETEFDVKGMVARFAGETGKTVALDVVMKRGQIQDLLRLAMRGNDPFVTGGVDLSMKFELPPGKGEIANRLVISGDFALKQARFSSATVQKKIDELSRRGQGKPGDDSVRRVASFFAGRFRLRDGVMTLPDVRFAVPGAAVQLAGTYEFRSEQLDFHGKLRLTARASQTMRGWKRIVLKPVDPFLAKEGAGVVLPIQIAGPRDNPKFGLDR